MAKNNLISNINVLHYFVSLFLLLLLSGCALNQNEAPLRWIKIDDFEDPSALEKWTIIDAQNETEPRIDNPQVTELRREVLDNNQYLLKKAAPDGIVGNRKALTFIQLPVPIEVGETYTLYVRLSVEAFSNNHVLGLSNMGPEGIIENAYNALEPSLRITDRFDSNINYKNEGRLQVRRNPWYDEIVNEQTNRKANSLDTNTWYEIWSVVNNSKVSEGGQTYDVYIRGGEEFPTQQKVYSGADFRMQRELPLIYFQATCNTGPAKEPYGNGGLRYDDLYMAPGTILSSPLVKSL